MKEPLKDVLSSSGFCVMPGALKVILKPEAGVKDDIQRAEKKWDF